MSAEDAASNAALRHSPLDSSHRALGARMVEFGGWDMPIQYSGVLDEHRACRERAVVFDVSHLGTVRVAGPAAFDVLQRTLTNDLGRIAPGRAQYTHLLDAHDAHVVDDIIVWWVADDEFFVMPNASNTDRLVGALEPREGSGGLSFTDITADRVVLAVQGPSARALLSTVDPTFADVGRFQVAATRWKGTECVVAGTGYTGEDGVEIHAPISVATDLWNAVLSCGVEPAGLGARDTLRLEAGLPLHGHELGPGITPLQAGLAWVVRFDKGDFLGRDALIGERDAGVTRRLRGFVADGRQPLREGATVLVGDAVVGTLTSGNISPVLGRGIGLGFVPPDLELGTRVDIELRGKRLGGVVVQPPFLSGNKTDEAS